MSERESLGSWKEAMVSLLPLPMIPRASFLSFTLSKPLPGQNKSRQDMHQTTKTRLDITGHEYEFDNYKYDFLVFELVMLTTRSSAILVVNRRADTRFGPTTILRTPVTSSVVLKSGTHSHSRTRQI